MPCLYYTYFTYIATTYLSSLESKSVQGNTTSNQTKGRKNGAEYEDGDDERGKPGDGNKHYSKSVNKINAKEGSKVLNKQSGGPKKKKSLSLIFS